jgi:hypothetical protein
MPEELQVVIGRLDSARRRSATQGWIAVGVRGRQLHRDFIRSATFDWVRWLRCELTVRRLIRAGEPAQRGPVTIRLPGSDRHSDRAGRS